MRARAAPPAIRPPGGSALATARPSTAAAPGDRTPRYVGVTSDLAVGSVSLPYPPGSAVGDRAVVFGVAGHNLDPDGRPDPFFLTGSPAPYAGTGPYPYDRYLDPATDDFVCSWGIHPYEPGGLRRDGRRFWAAKAIASLGDAFTVTVAPGVPEIAAFLAVFGDGTTVVPGGADYFDGGQSDNTLAWEDSGFGAEPPYSFPRYDYTTDTEITAPFLPFGPVGKMPYFLLFMYAPVLVRGVEGVAYPHTAVPPAAYSAHSEISPSYSYSYDPVEQIAAEAGAALFMRRASAGQDPASGSFSSVFFRATGVVPASPSPFTGYKYSYLAFDPIYWDYMHQQFRFQATATGIWTAGGAPGGAAAAPRSTGAHLASALRYQRFAQKVV